jgi:hypothetical protein
MTKVLFEMLKSDTSKVIGEIVLYKEVKLFQVKQLWRRDANDDWKYSKKIISFDYAQAHTFLKKMKAIDEVEFAEALGESKKSVEQ